VFVPGGIPVDIDAAARRQHEAAMGTAAEPAAPTLVQILPVTPAPASNGNNGERASEVQRQSE